MADRYWVGGSGTWDTSTTTNWATTSGGAGGASAPTSADNAYFDGNSDAGAPFTVTIGSVAVCADVIIGDGSTVTVLDQTMTLAGTGTWLVYGSLFFPATNLTRTYSGSVAFEATSTGKTITTNGVTLAIGATIFRGVGGEWTLGSSLTTATNANQQLSITNGSFITNNYAVTCRILSISGSDTRTIDLGSSVVTMTSEARAFRATDPTNLTFIAGTSTLTFSGSNVYPNFGGLTYYNIEFTNQGTKSLRQGFTANNLTISSPSAGVAIPFYLSANITITGTLTFVGSSQTSRYLFAASSDNINADSANPVIGVQRTITAAAISITSADFRDIVAAGAASWADGTDMTNCGDCKNNTGITFPAPKTVYRIGTGNWSATQWASTSGGSPAAASFPLAQDTAVFDANTATGTHTLDASYNIGSLNMSALTVAVTLATGSTGPAIYGNVTLDADVTLTGTGTITFAGQGITQTITSAGRTFTQPLTVNSPSGTVTLADALTTNLSFALTAGALDLGNQVLTCSNFASSNSNVRSIAFGTGKIVVTSNSTTLLDMAVATNFTFSGSGLIESNYSGSTGTRTFSFGTSGHTEANVLSLAILAGSDSISLASGAFFGNCNFTGFSGTLNNAGGGNNFYGDVTFSSSMNIPGGGGSISFRKTSGTQTVTSNGVTLNTTIEKIGAGSLQLADNLDLSASRGLLLTSGTVNLNSRTLTAGTFSSSNSNTRAIAFGTGGGITLSGSGTVFNATTGTNLTTTGTGVIDLTSASTKTFAGGGATYPTLNQGGSGTLLITGANTFADITNTVQPTTITFPSGVTTSVQDFNVNGTPGNLVTLNASTPGSRAFLNKI